MKVVRLFLVSALAVLLSTSAVADVTKTDQSPEVVIPRIKAKKYEGKVGITYTKQDNGQTSSAPIFKVSRHKVTPGEGNTAVLGVEIPVNSALVGVRALMRNEPWGGSQKPPKPNTDDLGSTDYKECPMDNRAHCPIAWAYVSPYNDAVDEDGRRYVTAVFRNWAGRNDRTGKLEVTYTITK